MNAIETTDATAPPLEDLLSLSNRLIENVGLVVLGKPEVIRLAIVALLADGHVLIEDVPGVGKTLLARALAASIDCSFRRIQFTPDLLPSDVLGSSIYHAPSGDFVFKPGPLFANVILADEINRTTPRTQSALLEAMSDRQVSVEGKTYPLES
jgi:MoxR-like ATPase